MTALSAHTQTHLTKNSVVQFYIIPLRGKGSMPYIIMYDLKRNKNRKKVKIKNLKNLKSFLIIFVLKV